jgi:hypothetical protein
MSQFAWLGLLKWSLQYQDGTENETPAEMSEENKSFLKKVMEEGIVDEGVRMTVVLMALVKHLHQALTASGEAGPEVEELMSTISSLEEGMRPADREALSAPPSTEHMLALLEELRDIVEQIDFAHSFAKMGGLPFLLGACSEPRVPLEVRVQCAKLLATLAQNNPDVQRVAHVADAASILRQLFLQSADAPPAFRAALLQALSAVVRGHAPLEGEFLLSEAASPLLLPLLSPETPPPVLARAAFFLRALLSSDTAPAPPHVALAPTAPAVAALLAGCADQDVRCTAAGCLLALLAAGGGAADLVFPHAKAIQGRAREAVEGMRGEEDEGERERRKVEVDLLLELMRGIKAKLDGK